MESLTGKTDSAIPAGTRGTVSIWRGGADTGENVVAFNRCEKGDPSGLIPSGRFVYLERREGEWVITAAECEPAPAKSYADTWPNSRVDMTFENRQPETWRDRPPLL